MRVHSDNKRAMYKQKHRSLTYLTINIANLSHHHFEVNGREERAGCFTLFVFLVFYDCYCFVALPKGDVGCHTVCDCGSS